MKVWNKAEFDEWMQAQGVTPPYGVSDSPNGQAVSMPRINRAMWRRFWDWFLYQPPTTK